MNDSANQGHDEDCTCDDCQAAFDAAMWGWLKPEHLAIVERERRTGSIGS
jgi:hypothetical protein